MKLEIYNQVIRLRKEPVASDFSGFGLLIYRGDVLDLPVSPLVKMAKLENPISEVEKILEFLFSISRYSDIRHDGYHLIHENLGLTHIAHFFAPPIPHDFIPNKFNVGARYRSAEIGSIIPTIASIVIFGTNGNISQFQNGIETANEA